jgi:hypothetical protein
MVPSNSSRLICPESGLLDRLLIFDRGTEIWAPLMVIAQPLGLLVGLFLGFFIVFSEITKKEN